MLQIHCISMPHLFLAKYLLVQNPLAEARQQVDPQSSSVILASMHEHMMDKAATLVTDQHKDLQENLYRQQQYKEGPQKISLQILQDLEQTQVQPCIKAWIEYRHTKPCQRDLTNCTLQCLISQSKDLNKFCISASTQVERVTLEP